jgi:hypothetical protein
VVLELHDIDRVEVRHGIVRPEALVVALEEGLPRGVTGVKNIDTFATKHDHFVSTHYGVVIVRPKFRLSQLLVVAPL